MSYEHNTFIKRKCNPIISFNLGSLLDLCVRYLKEFLICVIHVEYRMI